MSIIIRLQNLPWDASALNIRQFFYGLSIPDGGVHIIGGEKGDAFIAFSTDEDARQAMKSDGGYIGSTQVKLFLSSKAEMQSVILAAREGTASVPPNGPNNVGGNNLESNQSQRLRFISPAQNSGQPGSFSQPSYGPGVGGTRMNFMPQNQQPLPQPPQSQQFNRPIMAEYRPQGMEFRSPNLAGNEFRSPVPAGSRFQTFEQRPLVEPRSQRMNFDPRQPFHEQKHQQYWGGNQVERPHDQMNNQLYEPFGTSSEKQGFPFKKQDPVDRPPLMSPADGFGRRDGWNNQPRDHPRDFAMGPRQGEEFRFQRQDFGGNLPRGDFEPVMRGPNARREVENDRRRPTNLDDRFGPMGDGGVNSNDPPMGFGGMVGFGNERVDDQWRNEGPKFGVDRFSPRRDFGPDMYMDRGRLDFHDFKGFCVFVRDLPSYFGPRDVRELFRDCDLPSAKINIVHDRNGKKIGQVYLRLSCLPELDAAMREDGRTIEGRRIRVTRCHERDFEGTGLMESKSRPRHRSRSPRHSSETVGCFVVIKNLPGSSLVRKCLSDVKIARGGGPYMELDRNGKENGIALVELEHRKDLDVMLNKHKMTFGNHLAHIYKIPRQEFKTRVKESRAVSPVAESNTEKYTCVEIDGLSWGSTDEKVRKFFSGLQILPGGLYVFLDDAGKASGRAYVEFETPVDCSKAMEKHRQYLDNRYLVLRTVSRNEMIALLDVHIKNGGRFLNDTYKGRALETADEGSYEEVVVYMKNLNSRSRLEDILEFFHGYKIIKDSIQLQYKDDRPTGDGMVKFNSREEAEDAVLQLNGKVMLGKVVELLF